MMISSSVLRIVSNRSGGKSLTRSKASFFSRDGSVFFSPVQIIEVHIHSHSHCTLVISILRAIKNCSV
jgi:hypothetical protein